MCLQLILQENLHVFPSMYHDPTFFNFSVNFVEIITAVMQQLSQQFLSLKPKNLFNLLNQLIPLWTA